VKLRTWKPCFCHRLHLVPVLSRARSRSLMTPRLALGPALLTAGGAAKGLFALGSLIMSPMPFFFLGPGRALEGFGAAPFEPASICAALRLVPGFGPFLLGPGGASDDGVLPFMFAVESAGVLAARVGSTIWGGGASGEGFASSLGAGAGMCGNALSESGDSLSVTTRVFDFVVIARAVKGCVVMDRDDDCRERYLGRKGG
jgi:hypothetical protein